MKLECISSDGKIVYLETDDIESVTSGKEGFVTVWIKLKTINSVPVYDPIQVVGELEEFKSLIQREIMKSEQKEEDFSFDEFFKELEKSKFTNEDKLKLMAFVGSTVAGLVVGTIAGLLIGRKK